MHRMCQKAESPDHNPHLAVLKSHFGTLFSHLAHHLLHQSRYLLPHRRRAIFRLAFLQKCRPPDQVPEQCFAVSDLPGLRMRWHRCHCLNPNYHSELPHLTPLFCQFVSFDLANLLPERRQWEDLPHFDFFCQRSECFGRTLRSRWTDCHCGLTAGIAVLRWRATVLRAASHSGPLTDWTEQAYSGRCSMKSSTNSASACWRWIGYSGSWSSGRPSATSPAGREQPV